MFNDADVSKFKKIIIACGYTDGRLGIAGLSSLISMHYNQDPFEEGVLFLFCGRKKSRCKGLVWEGDGYLLLTKRLSNSRFEWPKNEDELKNLNPEQFNNLMKGLAVEATIQKRKPKFQG